MLNAPNFSPEKLASLEMILSLGAPLYQEHKDQLNRLLPNRFYELYGLTEGFWTILDKTQSSRKAGSVGSPPGGNFGSAVGFGGSFELSVGTRERGRGMALPGQPSQ